MLAGHWQCRATCRLNTSRLSSVSFPYSVIQPCPFRSKGSRPSEYPASTFGCVLAVFSAMIISQATDVTRACEHGTGSDHAPPASFSAAFRYRSRKASVWPTGPQVFPMERPLRPIGNAPGILLTLRSFIPADRVKPSRPRFFTPRVPFFLKRLPQPVLGWGIDRQILQYPCFFGRSTTDAYRGFRDCPCCKRMMTGPG